MGKKLLVVSMPVGPWIYESHASYMEVSSVLYVEERFKTYPVQIVGRRKIQILEQIGSEEIGERTRGILNSCSARRSIVLRCQASGLLRHGIIQ